MTDKELKKLSRSELLYMLLAQTRETERLQAELEAAQAELNQRNIAVDNAGSIAEASLQLNLVFDQAQAAASQYLDNIRRQAEEQDTIYQKIVTSANQEADGLLADASAKAEAILLDARQKADDLRSQTELERSTAQAEAAGYWTDLSAKLAQFYEDHAGLQELLEYGKQRGL